MSWGHSLEGPVKSIIEIMSEANLDYIMKKKVDDRDRLPNQYIYWLKK